jgi:Leucine-rich repeat (LRR) protein
MQSLIEFLDDDDDNRYGPATSDVRKAILLWISYDYGGQNRLTLTEYNIHTLPPLPDTVRELRVGNKELVYIPALPPNLVEFHCYFSFSLRKLPALPASLEILNIAHTQIRVIPPLGPRIRRIYATNAPVSVMPPLYWGIEAVAFGGTKITKIPGVALPETLLDLNIGGTKVSSLPKLNRGLRHLYMADTLISEIPEIHGCLETLMAFGCPNLIIPYPEQLNIWTYSQQWNAWHEAKREKKRIMERCDLVKEELIMRTHKPTAFEQILTVD